MSEAEKQTDTAPERIWIEPARLHYPSRYFYTNIPPVDAIPYVREDTRTRSPESSDVVALEQRCDTYVELWRDLAEALGNPRPEKVDIDSLIAQARTRSPSAVWDEAIAVAIKVCRLKEDSFQLAAEDGPVYAEDIELCQELQSKLTYALTEAKAASTPATGHCPALSLLKSQAASMIFDTFGNADLYNPVVSRNLVLLQARITEALEIAHRSADATPATGADEVTAALVELREMFPDLFGRITRQDNEKASAVYIGLHRRTHPVGLLVQDFAGKTISEAMQKVREWKEQQ